MNPVLCIFAHPDDEAFGPGGTIALLAQKRDVYIICVTNGDMEEQFVKNHVNNLEKVRHTELIQSAKILGVKKVFFLQFKDGSLNNNIYHEVASKIEEIIAIVKPDTILTYEPHGVSGHLDHIAVSFITTYVFYKNEQLKTLFYYCQLEDITNNFKDYFVYVPQGFKESEIDIQYDISQVWELKIQAMKTHVSQIHDVEKILDVISQFPKKEYFLKIEK